MDNKPLEKQAQTYIYSQLLRYKFKVNELSFDENGSDLYIIKKTKKKQLKYLTIQCKGRRLSKNSSSITIPVEYIQDNFLLFTYIIDDENEYLFMFFPNQIKEWKINSKNEYSLSLNQEKILSQSFQEKIFDKNLADKIEDMLKEVKEYTSIFIDGIFLEKAVNKTIKIYSDIYPDKTFQHPDLITIVKNILDFYNRYKTEKKIINCTLFMSRSFGLENRVDIDYDNLKFETKNGNQVRIFINKSDELIVFEILEELDRLLDNDNIVLVASDRAYEQSLSEYKKKEYDMIIIRSNYHDENDMYSEFRWGDITLPLGLALGLEKHEL